MTFRERVEARFEVFGHVVVRWRWLALASMLGLTVALGSLVPNVRVDNSNESFLRPGDEERIRYDAFKAQFDTDERVNIVLRPGEVFDLDFLDTLRRLHRQIEADVPYVDDVTSLINARNTRGEADELIVEDLMEQWPESPEELARLRARVLANPLYTNVLITEAADFTLISIKPFTYSARVSDADALAGFDDADAVAATDLESLTEEEGREIVWALRKVLAGYADEDLEIHLIGGPVMDEAFSDVMQRDMTSSFSLALIVITVVLVVVFRRVSGVLLPLLVVAASVVSAIGFMAVLDIPFSVTLNILPAFLMVVGICDSIHIMVIVYQQMARGSSKEEAIPYALGHSGLAVVMTSLTTAGGLLSFSVAELNPIAQLGIVTPIGIMLAMVYSLVLLPALLAIIPLRERLDLRGTGQLVALDGFLDLMANVSTRYPWRVVAGAVLCSVVAFAGVLQVRFSHDGIRWFPEDDPMRVAAELIDREFKGSSSLEAVIDTGRENGLHDPDLLIRVEQAMRGAEMLRIGDEPVSKAISIVDVLKETHQALNENDPRFYSIPTERQLVAQELLLFENSGSDDLEDFADSQLRTARITIRTPWVDAMLYPLFVEAARETFAKILPEDVTFELTGGAVLFTKVFRAVIISMTRSYVMALLVITPMLVLLVGNLKRGLLAMIPNLLPVLFILGLMGWADIPLDASTLLIGGVLLGVAVDDTIHFMHKFNRYFEDLGDASAAVRETLRTTGSALLFTSLVLALGFGVFMNSYMINAFWFGLLTSISTIVAFLADVLVAPALMVLATKSQASKHPATPV